MEKIAILGAGMVGRTIALDLSNDYDVTSFDISKDNLSILSKKNSLIKTKLTDLTIYHEYESILSEFNYVISAVPGFMGFDTLKRLIEIGKNVCDISFFPEDPLSLNELAKKKKVTVITDMGLAPGMSNLMLGFYDELIEVESFLFFVGGIPKVPKEPFKYKAPFSPIDVIEEYTRPARMQEDGKIVTKPALTERVLVDFTDIGVLEGFNTDGLRTLLTTMKHIPVMKEKTLRHMGHLDFILNLQEAGFFKTSEIVVDGKSITPLKLTSKLLVDQWKYEKDEEDMTVMKVFINGKGVKDSNLKIEYELLDYYDTTKKLSSMSRTTGYVCGAGINLIIKEMFNEKGVFPPELVGKNKGCFDYVMKYLKERNIFWKFKAC